MNVRMQLLTGAIAVALASGAAAAGLENPQNDWARGYDPDDPKWLAAPRTNSHPVDVMVFLAERGGAEALETLREWEGMPERRPILNSRKAYRDWSARRAEKRLAKIDTEEGARVRGKEAATLEAEPKVSAPAVVAADQKSAQEVIEAPATTLIAAEENAEDAGRGSEADAEFSAEIDRLRAELGQALAERDELAEKLATLEDEHQALLAEHQALQTDFADLAGEHEQLRLAYAELRRDHEHALDENRRLIAANAELQERVATLESTNKTLRLALIEHAAGGQGRRWAVESAAGSKKEAAGAPAITKEEPAPTKRSVVTLGPRGVDEDVIRLNKLGMEALEDDRPADAARWFLQAARAGSTNAMNNLGYLFEHGWGTIQSSNEAKIWYQRAAEGGHYHAMRNLARFYAQGIGGPKDMDVAAHWQSQADAFEAERVAQAQGGSGDNAPKG